MNLQQLKYLVTIADCHSITKASKKLFVSQPYLSKVVSDFEAKINKQLFIRHNNGLELTSEGHKVYLLAQSIISQMEQLENLEHEELPGRRPGDLVLFRRQPSVKRQPAFGVPFVCPCRHAGYRFSGNHH